LNNNTYVYVLVDPVNQSVFYVGRTSRLLKERLKGHLADARRKKKNKRSCRVAEILEAGYLPEIVEIAELKNASREQAIALEQAWIDFYSLTCDLTNQTGASIGTHGIVSSYTWGKEVLDELGKKSDYAIAKKIGCSRPTISNLRRSMGIPTYKEDYLDEMYLQLGVVSDGDVAKQFNLPRSTVKYIRDSLKIPAYTGCYFQWKPEHIEMLGVFSDGIVAEKIGCHHDTVFAKRVELGIAPCKSSGWKRRKDIKVKLEDISDKIGRESDTAIARDLNVCNSIVSKLRREAGIPTCPVSKIKWTEENIKILGTMPDQDAAKIIGCHSYSVHLKRKEMGIPASNTVNNPTLKRDGACN
jgi:hypothetical protein